MGWVFMLGVVVGIVISKLFNRFIDWLMKDTEKIDGGGYNGGVKIFNKNFFTGSRINAYNLTIVFSRPAIGWQE